MSNQSTTVHVSLVGGDGRPWDYDVPAPLRELIVADPCISILEPAVNHWHRLQQCDVAHFMSRAECDAAPSRKLVGAFCDQPFPGAE